MIEKFLTRNAGHPWDGRHGFDTMEFWATTQRECDDFVERASTKFWLEWVVGRCYRPGDDPNDPLGGALGGILYKPCGCAQPWSDHPDNRHPGANAS